MLTLLHEYAHKVNFQLRVGDNLQNGCDRGDLVDSGYSVLHCAAKAGRASTVKYLLELLVCDGCDCTDSKGTISADYVVDVNAKDDVRD